MIQGIRGMPDLFPDDALQHIYLIDTFLKVARLHGVLPLFTPILEPIEVFKRSVGETSDIVSKEMYTLEDRNGNGLCLRPEGTAGLVRALLNAKKQNELNQKYCYWGPMFRYERPQKGRLRQFHQIGVEYLATSAPLADAEIIGLASSYMEKIGIIDFELELNSLGDDVTRASHKKALVAYYKAHEKNLSEDSQRRLNTNPLRILDSKDPQDQYLNQNAPSIHNYLSSDAQTFFKTVCTHLETLNIPYRINPNLVRGLDYYSHTIFEFKSTQLGAQGTFLAGGRYDKLASFLGGKVLPSIGWAAGIERLALLTPFVPKNLDKVLVIAALESAQSTCFKLTHTLRKEGIASDFHDSFSIKSGLKRADKNKYLNVILAGENELAHNMYTLKDMKTGHQDLYSLDSLVKWLKKKTCNSQKN
jgi:histidyl-tRNA synthetase